MRALVFLLASLTCLLSPLQSGVAAPSVAGDSSGKSATYALAAGDTSTTEIYFHYLSRGSIFVPVNIYLSGPAGMKAVLEQKELKGSIPAALNNSGGWVPVATSAKIETKALSLMSAVTRSSLQCSDIPDSVYREELEKRDLPDNDITRGIICRILQIDSGDPGSPTPGPGSENPGPLPGYDSSVTATAVIKKDTCTANKNSKYLVRLKVSLAKVAAEKTASGFNIMASFTEHPWTGSRAASIKPTSDGKFAPSPIVMMVAMYGGDSGINVYKFSKGNPRFISRLPVNSADNFYRNGNMCSRTRVGSVLRGGRGVFEMTNGTSSYSVCFTLVRTRQRVNGFR